MSYVRVSLSINVSHIMIPCTEANSFLSLLLLTTKVFSSNIVGAGLKVLNRIYYPVPFFSPRWREDAQTCLSAADKHFRLELTALH